MLSLGIFFAVITALPSQHTSQHTSSHTSHTATNTIAVSVDSARHEITITAGPYHLPADTAADHHAMATAAGAPGDTPLGHFPWPIDGWFRGFRLRVTDGSGQPLPREIVHHLIVVNFSRRQLVYAAPERLFGAGSETDDAEVPALIGVPMSPDMRIGMYAGWHNATGRDLHDVYVKLTLLWTPTNQMPRPMNALPIYMDANLTVGGSNTFDVPPGQSSKSFEFTIPVSGRLLAVGGHMHDYGVRVMLEDATTGKVLARVNARRDSTGKIHGVERRLFGVSGDGLKLKAGRRYRITGVYDNPTGATLSRAAMAHMVGLFVPEDLAKWPAIDLTNADYQRDLGSLSVRVRDGQIELIGQ